MISERTPGPWSVTDGHGFEHEIWHTAPNQVIGAVYGSLADARLMAAAPELLAACLAALAELELVYDRPVGGLVAQLLLAIQKAEQGETARRLFLDGRGGRT